MVFLIAGVLTMKALPLAERFKGTKELAAEVTQALKPDDQIAAYNVGNRPGVVFYNSKPIIFLNSESEAREFIRQRRGFLFTHVSTAKFGRIFDQKGELAVII